ncbi:MAG: hypothetical protein PHT34_07450, partial [Oscillospiraceae bacterium]|nr:hypothetical protein [Oscillospiraceae bacterium]
LWCFRTQGAGREANEYRKKALDANGHVPEYLLKKRIAPYDQPSLYSWGSPEEAIIYYFDAKEAWEKTAGALAWLAAAAFPQKK